MRIPRTRYQCFHCKHEWKPRTKPGDKVFCPECGKHHTTLAGFKNPPAPKVYTTFARRKQDPSPAVKPYEPKTYNVKDLDGKQLKVVKEKARRS